MFLKAICIGVNSYEDKGIVQLDNAVNDATAVAAKIRQLGYEADLCVESYSREALASIEACVSSVPDEVNSMCLIYFSGHGFEMSGKNFLAFGDLNLESESQAKFSCIEVDSILELTKGKQNSSVVLVLDCCRDFPIFEDGVKTRGSQVIQLSPIRAPAGTLIAFSTSPGERAKDQVKGGSVNSPYAIAFLKALDIPNISIESMFKVTRGELLKLTDGKQNSWEHTSLVGNLIVNQGISTDLSCLNYAVSVLKDKNPYTSGDYLKDVFFDQLSGRETGRSWFTQSDALRSFGNGKIELTNDEAFLFGRNYVAALEGGSFDARDIILDNPQYVSKYLKSQDNSLHFCRGMLFEVYFDSNSNFRFGKFKSGSIKLVYRFINHLGGSEAFEWIASALGNHKFRIPILPSTAYKSKPVVTIGLSKDDWEPNSAVVSSVSIDGSPDVMKLLYNGELIDTSNLDPSTEFYVKFSTSAEVKAHLCTLLAVTEDAFELDLPSLVPPQTKYAFSDRTVILIS